MRILDADAVKTLSDIWLFLTRNEAVQFRSCLDQLLKGDIHDHFHMWSDDEAKTIMLQGYDRPRWTSSPTRRWRTCSAMMSGLRISLCAAC